MKPSDATTVRHLKRGTSYKVLGTATLQVAPGTELADMDKMVVYVGDSGLYVRPVAEFDDGRFEVVKLT